MGLIIRSFLTCILMFWGVSGAHGHFGMLIPSEPLLTAGSLQTISIKAAFAHPREGLGLPLAKPDRVGVLFAGRTSDLAPQLKSVQVMGEPAWQMDYQPQRPGVYIFHMVPAPYWEPTENCYIIHYTKTVVAAFGADAGWDQEVGLKTEIVPLSRPYGVYAGNLFKGVVKLNGKPAVGSLVEIEYYDREGKFPAANPYLVTQTVKADAGGKFAYAVPHHGWWGFAALNTADYTLPHEGKAQEVELGAVIWVYFHPWPSP